MKKRSSYKHASLTAMLAMCCIGLLNGCSSDPTEVDNSGVDVEPPGTVTPDKIDGPLDIVVNVDSAAVYGTKTFDVPAETNWVNSGLYLKEGETASISATGDWVLNSISVSADGDERLDAIRGCQPGALVARSGLRYQDDITCIGSEATFTAPRSDIVYLGMILSTDLGETYESRLAADGSITVTVDSNGSTVPSVRVSEFEAFDVSAVSSGWIELLGEHVIVTTSIEQAVIDSATVVSSIQTLDEIYTVEKKLRGIAPFNGQRIRFYADDASDFYMLAGNPIRTQTQLLSGTNDIRILRASVPQTDVWGFAHELGHTFSFANGFWLYQVLNLESWPNIFTLYALNNINRQDFQPNIENYCDGRSAYLSGGEYSSLRDDPFLQLCFLMEFTDQYGWEFWQRFFANLNTLTNEDVGYDESDESVWRFIRDQFSIAAGEDVTPRFEAWSVPLQ